MLNEIKLIGLLGKDPEIKNKANGDITASFSLATSERWKDKNTGQMQNKTQWHKVVVFQPSLAKVVRDYLKKGSRVYICGTMQYRDYEKDGIKRQISEVVMSGYDHKLIMLSSKEQGVSSPVQNQATEAAVDDDIDDELPF